jgi:hypothetical protein
LNLFVEQGAVQAVIHQPSYGERKKSCPIHGANIAIMNPNAGDINDKFAPMITTEQLKDASKRLTALRGYL